jgi:hypothetical protein
MVFYLVAVLVTAYCSVGFINSGNSVPNEAKLCHGITETYMNRPDRRFVVYYNHSVVKYSDIHVRSYCELLLGKTNQGCELVGHVARIGDVINKKILIRKPQRKSLLGRLNIDGRIILNWILKIQVVWMGTGLI